MAAAAGATLSLGGCGTASIDDAVPGARHTGQYPNLNVPQQAATTQLTDEEAASGIARLSAVRDATMRRSAEAAQSQAAALQQLGSTHADDALKEIGSE